MTVRHAAQGLDRLVLAAHHDQPGVAQAVADAGAVEKTAWNGVDAGSACMRRVEFGRGRLGCIDAPGRQYPFEFRKRKHLVDGTCHLGVKDLGLLGHARSHEHAAHVLAVALLHGQSCRHHGGDDGHEPLGEGGVVLAHVFDDRRARAGYVKAGRILLQVFPAGFVDQIGAIRDLDHVGETGPAQGSDHLGGRHGEPHREGRREQRRDGVAAL